MYLGIICFFQAKDEKEKKSLKKVSLAVVKQRRKETGTSELLKTLDEYVSLISNFYWYYIIFFKNNNQTEVQSPIISGGVDCRAGTPGGGMVWNLYPRLQHHPRSR